MKTSREQFDEWVKNNMHPSASNAIIRIAWDCWQASRQCIEVDNRDIVTITCEHGGDVLLRDITSIKIVKYKGA